MVLSDHLLERLGSGLGVQGSRVQPPALRTPPSPHLNCSIWVLRVYEGRHVAYHINPRAGTK